jgi:hypothetical protein
LAHPALPIGFNQADGRLFLGVLDNHAVDQAVAVRSDLRTPVSCPVGSPIRGFHLASERDFHLLENGANPPSRDTKLVRNSEQRIANSIKFGYFPGNSAF